MHISGIAECVSVEAEIHDAKQADSRSFNDIIGELQAALGALSDDLLRESLSGPFDFGMEDLCETDQAYQLYLMCPEAMVKPWSAIVKAILASAKTLKGRAPDAPRQTWVIDEAGRLFGYEQIVRLFTDGAGIGCRPLVIFQDFLQANRLTQDGAQLIASSAAVQIFFGVRDHVTAQRVSNLLGFETLEYDEPLVQSRAQTQRTSLLSSLFSGGDPLKIAVKLAGIAYEMRHKVKVKRAIRTPDEVRYGPEDALYLFADGLSGGVIGSRMPYWDDPMMTGRFLPNPYHPPYDKVRVTTRWGTRWRRVVKEPVPEAFADYPQYRSGSWTYVEGCSQ